MSKTTFSDGDSSTGVLGTIITAAFLNALNKHRHMGTDIDGDGALDYAVTMGSSNAFLLSFTQALSAYVVGMPFIFKASFTNTGAATMNIDSLGVLALKKNGTENVEAGDIVSGQLYVGMYDGTNIVILNVPKTTTKTSSYPENYGLAAAIASYALTVTRTDDDGNALSSSNFAIVPFRSTTLTLGTVLRMQYAAAGSITLPQGCTLGFTASESGRFYVYEGTDGTNTDIGVIRKAVVPEDRLFSSTAMSSSATSDTTLYSTAGRTSWIWKCVGYIEATMGTTLGNWSSYEKVQPMGPGIHRTNDIVQSALTESVAHTTGTTQIPNDGTIPQITEGDQYLAVTITPTNAINKLRAKTNFHATNSVANELSAALFQGAATDAIAADVRYLSSGGIHCEYNLKRTVTAGTTSSITFQVRAGLNASGTTTLNGSMLGNALVSSLEVEEIFA